MKLEYKQKEYSKWCRTIRSFSNEFLDPLDLLLDRIISSEDDLIILALVEKVVQAYDQAYPLITTKDGDDTIFIPDTQRAMNAERETMCHSLENGWVELSSYLNDLKDMVQARDEELKKFRGSYCCVCMTDYRIAKWKQKAIKAYIELVAFRTAWDMLLSPDGHIWKGMLDEMNNMETYGEEH